jgi:hypothetical protein
MLVHGIRATALLAGLAAAGCGAAKVGHRRNGTPDGNHAGDNGGPGTAPPQDGGGIIGGGGADGGGGGVETQCGVQNFMLAKPGPPDLLIVQDRSASMTEDASGGTGTPTKWASITAAINQVVAQVGDVNWGLLFFGSVNPFAFCSVPAKPDVACGPSTAAAIANAISATTPDGATPTAQAITAGVQYFKATSDGRAHYLLLATDGEPGCASPLTDVADAENAVKNAALAGIKTVVVGIGTATGAEAALTAMANNGAMPNTTPGQKPYYEVSTTNDLVAVLGKISAQIISCSYPLQAAPPHPDLVEIDGDGKPIPRDKSHMNGWDFGPGNLSIDFYGPACDALQSGATTMLSALFGCPPIG